MKLTKKVISVILAITTIMCTFCATTATVQAATTTAFNQISSNKPMKTYILSSSNIPCYTDSSLKTRGTASKASKTAYIAPSDDIWVYSVGKNSYGVYFCYVSYPVGKTRYKAYIPLSAVTANNAKHTKTTATAKVMTYKKANSSTGMSSMYISKGEAVYLINSEKNYNQVLYPCSGGFRLACVTKSAYNSYLSGASTSSASQSGTSSKFVYPMKSYTQTVGWSQNVSYMPSTRNDHLGIDLCPNGDNNIYAITNGTVKSVGYNSSNGYYVIIQHSISGKTVYSFYAHLKSYSVYVGQKVSAGDKIAIVGKSGSHANGVTHLHFAIANTCCSLGGYWGYSSSFSGNSRCYDGVTFYNPTYVISNGKLPS